MNANVSIWENRNKSTDILQELGNKKMLLVHNTFAKKEDIPIIIIVLALKQICILKMLYQTILFLIRISCV